MEFILAFLDEWYKTQSIHRKNPSRFKEIKNISKINRTFSIF
ncbi:conserved hypothetical protein [Aggregatibacter segnis ATCC 33393]|uniref:Uncharacterized protein n=2 Tax=Aggregatibacter segnis TaxID=739 RepID=E6L010_9PAST|nr:conserved hypothetical protein [Aggregatibacter segnis ATCC 33393]SQH63783.1 Uncharacterised protein [Aggregatibacter segnis ATCC 33393]